MASSLPPAEARWRRHTAAMKIVARIPPCDRWQLLWAVCWPSEAVEEAVDAAEETRIEKRETRAREKVLA